MIPGTHLFECNECGQRQPSDKAEAKVANWYPFSTSTRPSEQRPRNNKARPSSSRQSNWIISSQAKKKKENWGLKISAHTFHGVALEAEPKDKTLLRKGTLGIRKNPRFYCSASSLSREENLRTRNGNYFFPDLLFQAFWGLVSFGEGFHARKSEGEGGRAREPCCRGQVSCGGVGHAIPCGETTEQPTYIRDQPIKSRHAIIIVGTRGHDDA